MPDFYAPFQGSTPSDPVGTLTAIMGLKQRQQDLQKGALGITSAQQALVGQQAEIQSAQAKAQGDQQDMHERQIQQKMLATGKDENGDDITNGNGGLDLAKFGMAMGRTSPKTGQDLLQKVIKSQTDKVGLQAASQSLEENGRRLLAGPVQAAISNPKMGADQINAGIDNLVQQHPEMSTSANYLKGLVSHMDGAPTPQAREKALNSIANAMLPGKPTDTSESLTAIQGKKGINFYNTNANAATPVGGQVGQPVSDQGVAPQVVTTPSKQLAVATPSGGLSAMGGGGGAASAASPAGAMPGKSSAPNAPAAHLQALPRPGMNARDIDLQQYNDNIKDAQDHVRAVTSAANNIDSGVTAQRASNMRLRGLLKNADSGMVSDTGPGRQFLNNYLSWVPGVAQSDKFQSIGHELANSSIRMSQQMGVPNTNAGQEHSEQAAGNTGMNPNTLREVVRQNDALNTARDYYSQMLSKVSQNGADVSKVKSARQAFQDNYDPNAMRFLDAMRTNDTQELERLNKLPKAQVEAAKAHARVIQNLATKGDLQ